MRGRAGVVRRVVRRAALCDDRAGESMGNQSTRQRSPRVRVWVKVLPGVLISYCGVFKPIYMFLYGMFSPDLSGSDPLSFFWVTNRRCGDSERDLVICRGICRFSELLEGAR